MTRAALARGGQHLVIETAKGMRVGVLIGEPLKQAAGEPLLINSTTIQTATGEVRKIASSLDISELQRYSGSVLWFNPTRGFGFIRPTIPGKNVFVHYTAIRKKGFRSLRKKQCIEYSVIDDDEGRPKAVDVIIKRPLP